MAGGEPGWSLPFPDIGLAGLEGGGERLRQVLGEWGFAVVRGCVPGEQCAAWREGVQNFFESLGTRINFSDGDVDKGCPRSRWVANNGGILHNLGCGHLREAWEARQHPHVLSIWAAFYGTRRLVTSFDGMNADRPKTQPLRIPPKSGLHTDQSPWSNPDELICVQSALSLTHTVPEGAGTSVISRSHAHHRAMLVDTFALEEKAHKKDWIALTDEMVGWLLGKEGCELLHLTTSPGDLVLWDSRTIHEGRKARAAGTGWRFAFFICMWPADSERLDQGARERKARAFEGALTSSHWPDARETFSHMPFFQRGKVPPGLTEEAGVKKPPELSREGLQLAGVIPYG